jgi:predicted O-methyltransferase YrrM
MQQWRFPAEVPGWLTAAEGLALARLAQDAEVLEIGSYHGRSTVCMAQVARRLDSIDWHQGDAGSGPGGTLPALKGTLWRFALRQTVQLHVARTAEVAPGLPARSFDLAFVDGAHDEESVRIDVRACQRLVRPGGVIALHDYGYASVRRVADELIGQFPVGLVGSLAWFEVPNIGVPNGGD